MRILIVEDEKKMAEPLAYLLRREGYRTTLAFDGESGLFEAGAGEYDLIILDWMLPGCDGLAVLQSLRSQGIQTPVILLTAMDDLSNKVAGFEAGSDDYLVKPFAVEELLARIKALLRRRDKPQAQMEFSTEDFLFRPQQLEIETTEGERIHLTPTEGHLLELLLEHRNQVLLKETLFRRIWGYGSDSDPASVDLYVHYLRKKLPGQQIKTVRGQGYVWKE
ncbi:MAG TPA: response regulator transcription factor [Patescibacteria group bacterium]|nr:response regulator transcription factor [Patescibacteria group bacterium]